MNPRRSQPNIVRFGEEVLDRMAQAVERVAERLQRSTAALADAGIPFAVGGSNATSSWIATVDASAVRNARNVELVLFRTDLDRAATALAKAGFVITYDRDRVRFLDGPQGKLRDALQITFGGEPVGGHDAPTPVDTEIVMAHRVLRLDRLVEFQLMRYRLDDAVDLRDLIDVGLVDATWPAKYRPESASRLQHLLDTPDG